MRPAIWTRRVGRLQPGETAWLQGPYGRFGHLFCAVDRELIMIAGGIGITPMLSMLRFMADGGDLRPITLIWSNRSARQVVFAEEIADLETKLTGLRCIPIFTRDAESPEHTGRLNRTTLASLLTGANRQSAVFICGPPGMMAQLRHDLKALGFPARSLFSEAFGF